MKVFIGFASNVIPDNGAKHHLCDPFHLKKCFIFLLQCDFITHLQHAHSFVRLRLMLCPHMNLHAVSNMQGTVVVLTLTSASQTLVRTTRHVMTV